MAIFVTVIRYIQKNLSTTYDLQSKGIKYEDFQSAKNPRSSFSFRA